MMRHLTEEDENDDNDYYKIKNPEAREVQRKKNQEKLKEGGESLEIE